MQRRAAGARVDRVDRRARLQQHERHAGEGRGARRGREPRAGWPAVNGSRRGFGARARAAHGWSESRKSKPLATRKFSQQ
eukprot:4415052-Prymnesium_polylepis.1